MPIAFCQIYSRPNQAYNKMMRVAEKIIDQQNENMTNSKEQGIEKAFLCWLNIMNLRLLILVKTKCKRSWSWHWSQLLLPRDGEQRYLTLQLWLLTTGRLHKQIHRHKLWLAMRFFCIIIMMVFATVLSSSRDWDNIIPTGRISKTTQQPLPTDPKNCYFLPFIHKRQNGWGPQEYFFYCKEGRKWP